MAAQEVKIHDCPKCNKVFSSGKALGGHMSVVHSRCKKDLSSKKLETKQIKNDQCAEFKCPRCEKDFPSKKAMHGHMRMHSDRALTGATRPTKAGTKSSAVNQSPDLWKTSNVAVKVKDDYNVGKLVNVPEQRNFPGDYETGRKIVSENSMTTSAYYCLDCSLGNRWEDEAISKEPPESTKLTEGSGLVGEKFPADSKSGGHETFMQSSLVDGLEGTSCVEAEKLTGKKLNKRDSNLLEKPKTKRKKTDC